MRSRLRRHLSPGTVIGTIALFVALGGGYATAFSGSGSLQKAALDGVTQSASFEVARTLTGFGELEARCSTGNDEIQYRFDNTSSQTYSIYSTETGTYALFDAVNPGEQSVVYGTGDDEAVVKFYLSRAGGTDKAQAEITAHNDGPHGDDCGPLQARVKILVLNTQQ